MSTTDPTRNEYTDPTRNNTYKSSGLASLVGSLVTDITSLFRQEIELAKTEAGERVHSAANGGAMIAAGGVLALGALGVFLAGLVVVLATWLQSTGMDPVMANSLAALAVTVVVGVIAWILISNGIGRLKATNFKLTRTASTLSDDVNAVKERF